MRELVARGAAHGRDVEVVETSPAFDDPSPLLAAADRADRGGGTVQSGSHMADADDVAESFLVSAPAAPSQTPVATAETFAPAPVMAAETLDMVGRDNEAVRHRCEEIVRKVEEAATLRQDLGVVFTHVDTILRDLEKTKAALAQRTGAFGQEREAHGDLKARHRALLGEHERLREDHAALVTEKHRHFEAHSELEAKASAFQGALAEKTRVAADLARRGDGDRDRLAQMQGEMQAARDEVQRADELIFSMQADLSASRDHATLVEEDNKTLQANLGDARQQATRLARALEESELRYEAAKQKIDKLEAALSTERSDHSKIRGLYQHDSNLRRNDIEGLVTRTEALTARAEASERLLLEARAQLHSKIDDLRKAERRVQEVQAQATPLDARARGLEQENEELRGRLADIEASHGALAEHAEGLGKSVRAKERDAAGWRAKADALTERLHAETARFDDERDRVAQTIARLTEQYEKEKLERSLAEGALEAARKDRQLHQHALVALRNVQASGQGIGQGGRAASTTQVLQEDGGHDAEEGMQETRRRA